MKVKKGNIWKLNNAQAWLISQSGIQSLNLVEIYSSHKSLTYEQLAGVYPNHVAESFKQLRLNTIPRSLFFMQINGMDMKLMG